MSSSVNIDNKKKDVLILDIVLDYTQALLGYTKFTAEAQYSIRFSSLK